MQLIIKFVLHSFLINFAFSEKTIEYENLDWITSNFIVLNKSRCVLEADILCPPYSNKTKRKDGSWSVGFSSKSELNRIILKNNSTKSTPVEHDKWTNPVHFVIDSNVPEDKVSIIEKTLQWISDKTCVKFVQGSIKDRSYINYTQEDNSSCYTDFIGYRGKVGHKVNLGNQCFNKLLIHETLHIFGFYHEQSRPDRDRFVYINIDNIFPKYIGNFFKKSFQYAQFDYEQFPYDFGSILHYSLGEFAIDQNIPTMFPITKTKNPFYLVNQKYYHYYYLSELDHRKILTIFCPESVRQ